MSTSEHADQAPIITLAESFGGGDPVNALAIVLMKAWGEADPKSGVSQYPASYTANFADMARAALASTPSPAQPTEAITDEMAERLARIFFARTHEGRNGFHWPLNGERDRERDMAEARRVLVRVLGLDQPVAPSPVQGADDRLEAINAEVQELTRQGYPTGILVRLLATYQQSPQAALNEVRAGALEDAADAEADWTSSAWRPEEAETVVKLRKGLRRRAAELRAAPQAK